MKSIQIVMKPNQDPAKALASLAELKPHVTLAFGDVSYFEGNAFLKGIQGTVGGEILGCSTAGEISKTGVGSKSLVLTGIHFDHSSVKSCSTPLSGIDDSYGCGARLGKMLNSPELRGIFVVGPGLGINGSGLAQGLRSAVSENVMITGGLAGDDGAFKKTYTVRNQEVESECVVAVGFYGPQLEFGFGSQGGWKPFGPPRRVTKSVGTKMLELDGEKALNVYKAYLKDFAKDLPAAGLLFPFALLDSNESESGLIRTILGIDEEEGSLTLAGDIHNGQLVRLMHTENQGLVDGARSAAESAGSGGQHDDGVSILVSCVGRKLVMGEDVDEEIEAVQECLSSASVTGFYSYGEIGPFKSLHDCELHNQTMTVTYINEKKAA